MGKQNAKWNANEISTNILKATDRLIMGYTFRGRLVVQAR